MVTSVSSCFGKQSGLAVPSNVGVWEEGKYLFPDGAVLWIYHSAYFSGHKLGWRWEYHSDHKPFCIVSRIYWSEHAEAVSDAQRWADLHGLKTTSWPTAS